MVLIILSKNYLGILVGYNIEFTIKQKDYYIMVFLMLFLLKKDN